MQRIKTVAPMSVCIEKIAPKIKAKKRLVDWKFQKTKAGDLTKVPYSPLDWRGVGWEDTARFGTLQQAVEALAAGGFDGLGYFVDNGRDVFVDLDHVRGPDGAFWPVVHHIARFLDSYTEESPSGEGIHILAEGLWPTDVERTRFAGFIEVYTRERYATVTGNRWDDLAHDIEDRRSEIIQFALILRDWHAAWETAAASQRDKVMALLKGDMTGYASQSDADLALCGYLARGTNNDIARMDAAFRLSGLMRDKWDDPRGAMTYGERTLIKATTRNDQPGRSVAAASPSSISVPIRAGDIYADLPAAAAESLLPAGYIYSEHDIITVKQVGGNAITVVVSDCPIVFLERLRHLDTGDVYMKLAWKRGGRWHDLTESRATFVADDREITKLAGKDFPLGKHNKSELMRFLYYLDAVNTRAEMTRHLTSTLGWQQDGSFLWGNTLLGGEEQSIEFYPESGGDEQIATGYYARGTYAGWLETIAPLVDYPTALYSLYVGFAACVQYIVDAPNFLSDVAGPTSCGKTTTLRVPASVWGQPDEKTPDKTIHSWNATQVFIEQLLGVLHGLPALLDETKLARSPYVVDSVIYQFTEGHGRGRGDTKRMRRTRSWQTIGLSTGETPAAQFTKSAGLKTRVLEIVGKPLGDNNGELAIRLRRGITDNFGHAGPAFVQWLQVNRSRWGAFKQRYRDLVDEYTRGIQEREASRLAEYIALIAVTVELAHEAFELPWSAERGAQAIQTVWQGAVREAAATRSEEQALMTVLSWASANRELFYRETLGKPKHANDRDPFGATDIKQVRGQKMYGRWDMDEHGEWEALQIEPDELRKVLEQARHNEQEIKQKWRDRGWITCQKDGRLVTKRRIVPGEPRVYVVEIRRCAERAIYGDEVMDDEAKGAVKDA